ncbi:hypothetical protein Cylst_1654 [Cylindrospermum stagnale PCC 7417]|uniref:Uncharacterized protein n=1 Tax=Cylindrospermum stagnale PCC 7417 TaxID=56107 RepID=K9WVT2_9NOST|nr:hypothetical protein [Cylindrospermum stagnale]AFZ23929.1 hypothetical protein Cylst_1654 [Cylindrospermum stagnale PCC 7417]
MINFLQYNLLKIFASRLGSEVVSGESLTKIYALTQRLPIFENILLECRLAVNNPQIDISTMVLNHDIHLPKNLLKHHVWKRLQTICEDWANPDSFLNEKLREIWLEFDLHGKPSDQPIPGIFLVLNLAANWDENLLLQMAQNLFENQIKSKLATNLKICFDTLTDTAKIIYLAAMLSRNTDILRLNISGLPQDKLAIYLDKIGWNGSVSELEEIISKISAFTDTIVLSFDVGETVLPRIGLECYLLDKPQDEPRWQLFLDYLISQGLCSLAKSKAVLAWTEFQPQELNVSANFTICTKIVYQTGMPLEAKAYLGFWPY